MRGVPKCVRSDNGPEFIAQAIRHWLDQVDVETLYIEPGSPWENGYAESFHSRLRDEFLAGGSVREPDSRPKADQAMERRLQRRFILPHLTMCRKKRAFAIASLVSRGFEFGLSPVGQPGRPLASQAIGG